VISRGVWFAVLSCWLYIPSLYAQEVIRDTTQAPSPDHLIRVTDSTAIVQVTTVDSLSVSKKGKPKFLPVPKRALRISLLTPVLAGGQIYNRDYWKLPFVYAGYGASIYFILLNVDRYGTMVDHYKSFYFLSDKTDPNYGKINPDIKTVEVFNKAQNRYIPMTIDNVRRAKDTYRRWRDWSFFAVGAVYALAAIEANVAAHLKTFDLSDDLSMRVQPSITHPQTTTLTPGVKMVFVFK
jgi:hypothetical protein